MRVFLQEKLRRIMMKRRDNKGRLLHDNEFQRKDGRYQFRYMIDGKPKYVYSWRLTENDTVPKGKRSDVCLRNKELEIQEKLSMGLDTTKSKVSLNECFDDYISVKRLKERTKCNYIYCYDHYVRNSIGTLKISAIKYTDIKNFYIRLLNNGMKIGSVKLIHSIIHPVFSEAVRDDLILKNPSDGAIKAVQEQNSNPTSKKSRHALTAEQQSVFINYVKNSDRFKKWLPLFTFLLGTGARIGETLGLTWNDIDFNNQVINITHSLSYGYQKKGEIRKRITTPKTSSGVRQIPMLTEVRKQLLKLKELQMKYGIFSQETIDGYSGFVFLTSTGNVYTPPNINVYINNICNEYNELETQLSIKEKRSAVLLPKFSAHTLRHTFCSRFCENEPNVKIIQEIMGHSDIATTMDIYSEISKEKKQQSFFSLDSKIMIG